MTEIKGKNVTFFKAGSDIFMPLKGIKRVRETLEGFSRPPYDFYDIKNITSGFDEKTGSHIFSLISVFLRLADAVGGRMQPLLGSEDPLEVKRSLFPFASRGSVGPTDPISADK